MNIFAADLGPVGEPRAVLDRAAFERNLASMREAAVGVPLRVATKSIRVRSLIEWCLTQDCVAGLLSYAVREALWLVSHGHRDVLVAYPSADLDALAALARDETACREVTLMVDCASHVAVIAEVARAAGSEIRVALDVDMSLKLGPVIVGAHRTNVHSVEQAVELGRLVTATPGVRLVGCMFYEAQVAGVPDSTPGHRLMKWASMRELGARRRAVVEALSDLADLEIINGGGTGSVHISGRDGVLHDIAVGSGLFAPVLFDGYRALRTEPACYFVSPVVRKPRTTTVVTYSGGYIGSGPPGKARVPKPVHPVGLRYYGQLGAGEVQTPLHGASARGLEIGDHVWFRHSKAGEMCERFDEVFVVEDGAVSETVATYRGEGQNFG